jgi:cation transport ATPase-like protein
MSTAAKASTTNEVEPWHAISQHEVEKRLATSCEKGLDPTEAATRIRKFGPNRLPEGRRQAPFARLLAQFNNIQGCGRRGSANVARWIERAAFCAIPSQTQLSPRLPGSTSLRFDGSRLLACRAERSRPAARHCLRYWRGISSPSSLMSRSSCAGALRVRLHVVDRHGVDRARGN